MLPVQRWTEQPYIDEYALHHDKTDCRSHTSRITGNVTMPLCSCVAFTADLPTQQRITELIALKSSSYPRTRSVAADADKCGLNATRQVTDVRQVDAMLRALSTGQRLREAAAQALQVQSDH